MQTCIKYLKVSDIIPVSSIHMSYIYAIPMEITNTEKKSIEMNRSINNINGALYFVFGFSAQPYKGLMMFNTAIV